MFVFVITMRNGSVDSGTSETEVACALDGIRISDRICVRTDRDNSCHADKLKIKFYSKNGEVMGCTAGSRCLGTSNAAGDESIIEHE